MAAVVYGDSGAAVATRAIPRRFRRNLVKRQRGQEFRLPCEQVVHMHLDTAVVVMVGTPKNICIYKREIPIFAQPADRRDLRQLSTLLFLTGLSVYLALVLRVSKRGSRMGAGCFHMASVVWRMCKYTRIDLADVHHREPPVPPCPTLRLHRPVFLYLLCYSKQRPVAAESLLARETCAPGSLNACLPVQGHLQVIDSSMDLVCK